MRRKNTIIKILKLKENRKREMEIEVKKAHDKVDEEDARLQSLENNYKKTLESFNGAANMEVKEVNDFYGFFLRLNESIEKQKNVCSDRINELEQVKDGLITAHKEEKIIEIMKDKVVNEEKKEREKSEQKEADFITVSRKLR
jgi:flagellar export protein FliJ